MELFRRQERKALRQVESHLGAEKRQGAGSGAVHLLDAVVEDPLHEVEILAHGPTLAFPVSPSSGSFERIHIRNGRAWLRTE